jgi:hypothetical protein
MYTSEEYINRENRYKIEQLENKIKRLDNLRSIQQQEIEELKEKIASRPTISAILFPILFIGFCYWCGSIKKQYPILNNILDILEYVIWGLCGLGIISVIGGKLGNYLKEKYNKIPHKISRLLSKLFYALVIFVTLFLGLGIKLFICFFD